jgi:diguanylate cyclase (GGDEF)-like protein
MKLHELRVAHIDDDDDLLAMTRLVLQSRGGCVVLSCASGKAALEAVPGFRPHLILVDYHMPGMSGLETIQALRARMDLSGVRIVFATALAEHQDFADLEATAGVSAVIGKPIDADTLFAQLDLVSAPTTPESIRARFLKRLRADLQSLSALLESLPATGSPEWQRTLSAMFALLHRLAGTAGTFGFGALGATASALSIEVKQALDHPDSEPADFLARLPGQIAELTTLNLEGANSMPEVEHAIALSPTPHAAPRVGVIAGKGEYADHLAKVLRGFGYQVEEFSTPTQLERAKGATELAAVVLKLDACAEEQLAGLKRIRAMRPDPVPSIVITEGSGFDDYLAAVRAGAEGFFVEPVDLPQLESRLHTLIENQERAGLRVMLVDDDTDLLALCTHVLESAHMVVFREDTPAAALAGLEAFRPEVILLDVRMPECSGPELAQIIRLDERWMHVPIVYMSSQSDGEFQLLATRKAGEGFLAKPIEPKELIATVCANGRHSRHMIETTSKDSLTGLLRHSFIKDHLAAELERSQRLALTTCAVVVDIDKFKQVNDQHGHQVGDVVIRTLASLLRQRLRSIDGVGRLGGEEFLAVLSNCTSVEAATLIDEIREHFASIEFAGCDGHFRCTFSAGIAQLGAHASAGELLGEADRAMYRAKKLGRNRVVCGAVAALHTARAGGVTEALSVR